MYHRVRNIPEFTDDFWSFLHIDKILIKSSF